MENVATIHLEKIHKMLLAMARGNFFYRLERSDTNDTMEAISLVLNMLAEEIQEALVHEGFVNATGVIRPLVQLSFFMDGNGTVQMVNQNACSVLSVHRRDIIGGNFQHFLHGTSIKTWSRFLAKTRKRKVFDTTMELTFVSKVGLLVPHVCHVTTSSGIKKEDRNILVTVVLKAKDDQERFKPKRFTILTDKPSKHPTEDMVKARARLSFEDIRKIREGRNIILNNLETDLPSLKDFAHQLGTNEFKLKYGFRELFGTSVYRFLLQERLRKAKMLIQHTDANLKTIAFGIGFKTMPHFSRAFKKNYGYPPSELRKLSRRS